MSEIMDLYNSTKFVKKNDGSADGELSEITERLLCDIHNDIRNEKALSMPIGELATLGAGVSSLIPALQAITQTATINTHGLYQLANGGVGDVLKTAKNGNFWGAFKTVDGGSKFAQLKAAEPISISSKTVMSVNPATILMAVALFSIEKQLKNIAEMEKKILAFLETEKESEIEADVKMLSNIISKYKYNWDNEHFVSSNHKMVLDVQRTARKNMIFYQKNVMENLSQKKVIANTKLNFALEELRKKFEYYRLSLYTFSMASLIEIMLSGNFKEENIAEIKTEIETYSLDYRNIFTQCSTYLEKLAIKSVKTNVFRRIGDAGKMVSKVIGSIPVAKEVVVDELLQIGGEKLTEHAQRIEKNVVKSFAEVSSPGTGIFVEKMNEMIQIYNHTSEICLDDKRIYLITE